MEAWAIFLNLFTVCLACKWRFVIYPFANGLNRLNGLSHLCILIYMENITNTISIFHLLLLMEIGNGN
jgi:hypothetical protein